MSVFIGNEYTSSGSFESMARERRYPEYSAAYPDGMNLQPDSDQHGKIVQAIMRRARSSHSEMQKRHYSWDKIDETMTAYIPVDESERLRKEKDSRKPVSIVFPVTYTIHQTIMTHYAMAELVDPFFRYQGKGPEDHAGAILLEKVIDSQFQQANAALNIYTMVSDALKYGFGGVSCVWEQVMGKRTAVRGTGFYSGFLNEFWPTGRERFPQDAVKFEGNRLVNIDPRRYLPDVNRPVHEVQEGEFSGWVERTNYMRLRQLEQQGELFNVKYLKGRSDCRSNLFPKDDAAKDMHSGGYEWGGRDSSPVDVIWMYIKVIPEDWHLGDGEDVELYIAGIAADGLLIKWERLDQNHGMIPLAITAPNFDGHSVCPISDLEVTYGSQNLINWLGNAHVKSQMQLVRNLFVYDPSQINSEDMNTPERSLVRARRKSFGSNLRDAIFQLPINDVTQKNLGDIGFITDLMQRVTGATDPLQGVDPNAPERRSADEAKGMRQSAFARVAKMIRLINWQAKRGLGTLYAEHTQQYMSQQTWAQTLGNWPQALAMQYGPSQPIPVTPEDIVVNYDVMVTESGSSGGESVEAAVQVFQAVASNPMLMQQFDMTRIFMDVARLAGFKNLQDYMRMGGTINPVVQGTEQIQGQVDAGNIVPMAQGAVA